MSLTARIRPSRMCALFWHRLSRNIAAPADDHLAMVDKQVEHLADVERFGPVIDQRDIGDCEGGLQRGVFEKFIQRDLRVASFLISTTILMPWRSDSSRTSEISAICPSRTHSAIFETMLVLTTI